LAQKLRLSLHPVFQIMARQAAGRYVDRTSARRDLFVGWPGLLLLEGGSLRLASALVVFHVLAHDDVAHCRRLVGSGVWPVAQFGGFACFVLQPARVMRLRPARQLAEEGIKVACLPFYDAT
jgi:hypothetical protein